VVIHHILVVIRHVLVVIHHILVVIRHVLVVIHHILVVIRHVLVVIHHILVVIRHVLVVIHHILVVIRHVIPVILLKSSSIPHHSNRILLQLKVVLSKINSQYLLLLLCVSYKGYFLYKITPQRYVSSTLTFV